MSSTRSLYRSLLREFRLALRSLVTSGGKDVDRALLEARDFLKAKRIHHELVKRYNPTHDMTQEERVAATARRVGLDKPEEFKGE
ncbi:hypothetical protein A1Q2_03209 [Trichosporon asahii var. asahii CBS 8904]|uniref:Uncharacterized protein n=2 Tax=Trichosporon asahii var. asahii TaxID=189963 RepID=K1WMU1_TRIAC|nr:hypothetical protein A1Q1_06735 [Trichosporon asahii var. asahii CBS 2479]EJT52022.1 hypothetical protein A1Q1_06735 [Trichosporon asahii var. asahii CBS 2479]EKD02449.1 hypothetical protein A1Q2_03209 [Trichosporon asahii var. asahii CBS 8904]